MRNISNREERFRSRISTERQILTALNGTFADTQPISALSFPAISLWMSCAYEIYQLEQLGSIEPMLRELSERLRIQTDNSREVFDVPAVGQARPIDFLVQRITAVCERASASFSVQTGPTLAVLD